MLRKWLLVLDIVYGSVFVGVVSGVLVVDDVVCLVEVVLRSVVVEVDVIEVVKVVEASCRRVSRCDG